MVSTCKSFQARPTLVAMISTLRLLSAAAARATLGASLIATLLTITNSLRAAMADRRVDWWGEAPERLEHIGEVIGIAGRWMLLHRVRAEPGSSAGSRLGASNGLSHRLKLVCADFPAETLRSFGSLAPPKLGPHAPTAPTPFRRRRLFGRLVPSGSSLQRACCASATATLLSYRSTPGPGRSA